MAKWDNERQTFVSDETEMKKLAEDNITLDPNVRQVLDGYEPVSPKKSLEQRVYEWNRNRGNLEFKFSREIAMLTEEAREFFNSTTLVNRLREWADILFVWCGTKAKYFAHTENANGRKFLEDYKQYKNLRLWVSDLLEETGDIVRNELKSLTGSRYDADNLINSILAGAFEAVIYANENKGTERDANGKIQKGPNYIAPDKVIKDLIENKLKIQLVENND